MTLPQEMLSTVGSLDLEPGWRLADFPTTLEVATRYHLACVGGQLQFQGPIGIADMYWLSVESSGRRKDEDWDSYVRRANSEVLAGFRALLGKTDLMKEARDWPHISKAIDSGQISDPLEHLYFVAYFDPEKEPNQSSQPTPTSRRG